MSVAEPSFPACLEGLALPRRASEDEAVGVVIRLFDRSTVVRIMPFGQGHQATVVALSDYGFVALPAPGKFLTAGSYRLAWAGQGCWHLLDAGGSRRLAGELAEVLNGYAAISSAGDGMLRMCLRGPCVRDVLVKGCVLDLDRFGPGQSAVTRMAHTKVHLLRLSEGEFELMVPVSHAVSFWDWLEMSAEEFGMVCEPG